jgi:hypothetical protein
MMTGTFYLGVVAHLGRLWFSIQGCTQYGSYQGEQRPYPIVISSQNLLGGVVNNPDELV